MIVLIELNDSLQSIQIHFLSTSAHALDAWSQLEEISACIVVCRVSVQIASIYRHIGEPSFHICTKIVFGLMLHGNWFVVSLCCRRRRRRRPVADPSIFQSIRTKLSKWNSVLSAIRVLYYTGYTQRASNTEQYAQFKLKHFIKLYYTFSIPSVGCVVSRAASGEIIHTDIHLIFIHIIRRRTHTSVYPMHETRSEQTQTASDRKRGEWVRVRRRGAYGVGGGWGQESGRNNF